MEEQWAQLAEAFNDVEAEIICGLLQSANIPCRKADRDALADLIRRLRSIDPVDTLTSLLDELHLGKYPLLHGKQFEVTVGMGGQPGCSVALVASAAQVTAGGSHAER